MRRYLLDTGAAGDCINRRCGVRERAREEVARGNRIGIGVPVLAELWFGVENSATRDRNAPLLRRALTDLVIWPLDPAAAEEYGRLAAALHHLDRPTQQIDNLIAAIALTLGTTIVVSSDTDLTAVPGLSAADWATG